MLRDTTLDGKQATTVLQAHGKYTHTSLEDVVVSKAGISPAGNDPGVVVGTQGGCKQMPAWPSNPLAQAATDRHFDQPTSGRRSMDSGTRSDAETKKPACAGFFACLVASRGFQTANRRLVVSLQHFGALRRLSPHAVAVPCPL